MDIQYNIILKQYKDKDAFIREMQSQMQLQNSMIPQRSCRSIVPDPKSRILRYELSESEVDALGKDPRIKKIVKVDPNILPTFFDIDQPLDDKPPSFHFNVLSEDSKYYGDQYATITLPTTPDIDMVIIDSIVAPNHSEFIADSDPNFPEDSFLQIFPNTHDNSRVFRFKNLDNTNISYLQNNHGTLVGSIAAGKTQGWSRDARIITTNLYDFVDNAQEILNWHVSKSGERPTIVNCSFGWSVRNVSSAAVSGIYHQGTEYTKPVFDTEHPNFSSYTKEQKVSGLADFCNWYTSKGFAIRQLDTGGSDPDYKEVSIELAHIPAIDPAANDVIDEFIASGMIVVAAGGNSGFELDLPGGANYNNRVIFNGGTPSGYYYNRPSTPASIKNEQDDGTPITNETISVGSISSHNYKSKWSVCGSGITIFAPGAAVVGATFNENSAGAYVDNVSGMNAGWGTSFSSPQVCGILGQVAQSKKNSGVNATVQTITKTVTLNNSTAVGVRFEIDGSYNSSVNLYEGNTYQFDLSDTSIGTHVFRLSTIPDGRVDGVVDSSYDYNTGVTITSNQLEIVVPVGAPDLYYYCAVNGNSHKKLGYKSSSEPNIIRVTPNPIAGWPSNSNQAQASGLAYVTGTAVDNLYDTGIVGTGAIVYDEFYSEYGVPGSLNNDLAKFSLKGAPSKCIYFDATYEACGDILEKPPAAIGDIDAGDGSGGGLDESGRGGGLEDNVSGEDSGYTPSSTDTQDYNIYQEDIEKIIDKINKKTADRSISKNQWWWQK